MPRNIYEVSAEIAPTAAADFPNDASGAFVVCYVPAESLRDSLDVAEQHLEAIGFRVVDLDHSLRIGLDEYEPHEADYPSRQILSEALSGGGAVCGPFLCYPDSPAE